jgi:hypothetical protein
MWSILLALPRTAITSAGRKSLASVGVTIIETRALLVPSAEGDRTSSSSKAQCSAVGTSPAASYAARAHFQAAETAWAVALEL